MQGGTIARRAAAFAVLTVLATILLPARAALASSCDAGTQTIRWVGRGATNDWNDPNNWLPNSGRPRVPGAGDHVCVPAQPAAITITHAKGASKVKSLEAHEALDVSGGSLAFTDTAVPTLLQGLTLDGGTVGGQAPLSVSGSLAFQAGTLGGAGGVLVPSGAAATIATGQAKTVVGTLTLNGPTTWTGDGLHLNGGAKLANGGALAITPGVSMTAGAGASIVNTGTLTTPKGSAISSLDVPVQNGGSIAVTNGTLRVRSLTNGGGVAVGGGATLQAGSMTTTGTVVLDGTGVLAAGGYTQSGGRTELRGAASVLRMTGAGKATLGGGALAGVGTVDGPLVEAASASIEPGLSPGSLRVSGPFTQNGGAIVAEIAGAKPGSGFDRLVVSGPASLEGTLRIVTGPGFQPKVGQAFRVLTAGTRTGEFGAAFGRDAGSGRTYEARYGAAGVTLVVVRPVLSVADLSVHEGDAGSKDASFLVELDRPSATAITVGFATHAGTATSPAQFQGTSGTVTFPAGVVERNVPVAVHGDKVDEPDQTFTLRLSGATNASIGDAVSVATILDDDVPPPPSPVPSVPPPVPTPSFSPPPIPPLPTPTTVPSGNVTGGPPTSSLPPTTPAPPIPTLTPTPAPTPSSPQPGTGSPSAPPPASGSPSAVPPSPAPSQPPPPSRPDNPDRSRFVVSVSDPRDIPWTADALGRSALLAAALLLLVLFPSVLFNSTLEENYEEVRGWFAFLRRGSGERLAALRAKAWFAPAAFVVLCLLGAVLYGFLSPGFGFHRSSLALLVGLFAGLLAVTLIAEVPVLVYGRRHGGGRGSIRILAGSLLVGVVCVAISRIAHFSPGYLYGVIAGAAFQHALKEDDEGRATTFAAVALLVASVVAWLAWIPVNDAASKPGAGLGLLVLDAVLVAVFVTGVEAVLIGLLPLRFLDGHKVFRWQPWVWAALFGLGAFVFVHLLLRPGGGYFSHANNTPLLTMLGLLLGFGLVSVAFWGYFALRKRRAGPPPEATVEAV